MKKLPVFLLIVLLAVLPVACKKNHTPDSAANIPSYNSGTVDELVYHDNNLLSEKEQNFEKEDSPGLTEPEPAPPKSTAPNPVVENEPAKKSCSWYFSRNNNHEIPAVNEDIKTMLADYDAFYVLPNTDNKIYLTFDEGYEYGFTPQILDILKANNVPAAFFVTGHYLKTQPDLVKRMKDEGHLVCNHTFNHPDLSTVSRDKFEQEISSLESECQHLTGVELDKFMRPPMGNYSAASLNYAQEMGYRTVFWSMAFQDWDTSKQPGAEYSYQHVVNNIHPGAVILLHAVSQSNTEALDRIIKDLTEQGYVFAKF
jgi:peptidoglycan-N-acetylmuramic acid deacetylase